MPKKLTDNTSLTLALILKNPSKSDLASIKEFLTFIEAPCMGPVTLKTLPKM